MFTIGLQKLGRQEIWNEGDGLPSKIVVDETVVKIGNEYWYLYAAISPRDRRILYASIYPTRNHLTTKSFFREMMRKHRDRPETAIVDGGSWYKVIERFGIDRCVVSGKHQGIT